MNHSNQLTHICEKASQMAGIRSRATAFALLVTGLVPSGVHATLGTLPGSGTSGDPYQVSDYADLTVVGTGSHSSSVLVTSRDSSMLFM